jgi:transcriptional regulator with XRE-family HTH domain
VAEAAGIKQAPYHRIETGITNPRVPTAKRIAKFLDFPWTEFFKDVA